MAFFRLAGMLVVVCTLASCDALPSDPGGDGSEDELVGTWTGTSYLVSDDAGAAPSFDAIVDAGWTMELAIAEDGTYTYSVNQPGEGVSTEEGTYEASESEITISSPDGTATMQYTLEGDGLMLVLSGESWDLDNDGHEETVTETIQLGRGTLPTSTSPVDPLLVGSWWVTEDLTSSEDRTHTVDFVEMGHTAEIEFRDDGTVFSIETDEHGTTEQEARWSVRSDTLRVVFGSHEFQAFTYTLGDQSLHLVGAHLSPEAYDFDGDGTNDPGWVELRMDRCESPCVPPEDPADDPALVGEWVATSVVHVNPANESQTVDPVAEGLITMSVTVGATSFLVEDSGEAEPYGGSWTAVDGILTLSFEDGTVQEFTYEVSAESFVMTDIDAHAEAWDWDDDGEDDAAIRTFTWERQ